MLVIVIKISLNSFGQTNATMFAQVVFNSKIKCMKKKQSFYYFRLRISSRLSGILFSHDYHSTFYLKLNMGRFLHQRQQSTNFLVTGQVKPKGLAEVMLKPNQQAVFNKFAGRVTVRDVDSLPANFTG